MKLHRVHAALYLASSLSAIHGSDALASPDVAGDLTHISIEQLLNIDVVTASRLPQRISEAPSSVSVILADDIRRHGHRTLADILRSMRGVYVSYDRNYSFAGTRGSGRPGDFNTRLLILIDGLRLNDVVFDQGALGTEFPIDISLIERVEFVPGPGSALYGSSAFFGVVNIITKKGGAYDGATLEVGAASAGGRGVHFSAGKKHGQASDMLVSASSARRRGADLYFPEFASPAGNDGIARGLDHDRQKRVFGKFTYGDLGAQAYLAQRIKGIPTASYGQQFNDPRSHTVDEYAAASLTYQKDLSPTLAAFASVNLSRYRYDGVYIYAPGPTANIDRSASQTSGAELRLLSTGMRGHRIIGGIEFLDDRRRAISNADIEPELSYVRIDKPKRRAAVYVQDEVRLGEQWLLNAGVRRDFDSESGHTTNPRIALIHHATPEMTLKGIYGSAYRAPNAYERYYASDIVNTKLNPALRPERIHTNEFIAEYFPIDRFRATMSLYQYRLRDLVALATDPADGLLVYANIDAARARGIELEAEWLRENGSAFKGSASFQTARDQNTNEWLNNSPRRLVKLSYSTPLPDERLRASLEYQFTSRRRTTLDDHVGGFGVLNLTLLGHVLDNRIELVASLYNVLDKRYADSPSEEHFDNAAPPRYLRSIRQDGRNWRVTATYKF